MMPGDELEMTQILYDLAKKHRLQAKKTGPLSGGGVDLTIISYLPNTWRTPKSRSKE